MRGGQDAPPVLVPLAQPGDEAPDAGADDCKGKPFLVGDMGARPRRPERRTPAHRGVPAVIEAEALEIDCVLWQIRLGETEMRLSVSECAMLRMPIERAGAVVEMADARRLLQAMSFPHDGRTWGDEAIGRLVGRLRSRLDLASDGAPDGAPHIETLPRLGHRLRPPMRAGRGVLSRGRL